MADERFHDQELDRFWDAMRDRAPETTDATFDLDPATMRSVRRIHRLGQQKPPDAIRDHVRRNVLASIAQHQSPQQREEHPMSQTTALELSQPFPVPNGRHAPAQAPRRTAPRRTWLIAQIATALLLVITLVAGYFAIRPDHPAVAPGTPIPATPVESSVGDWSQYGGGPARQGVATGSGPVGQPALLWKFKTGGGVTSSPAVVASVVYVGSGDGNLYALDATAGTEIWRFASGLAGGSAPAVAAGLVYVGSEDGILHAVDTATGTERWSFPAARANVAPAVADGAVYAGGSDDNLYALDAQTGAKRWAAPIGAATSRSPAVADGVVYVGSDDGALYAIDTATGTQRWRYEIEGGEIKTPSVARGVVYVSAGVGATVGIYAIDASTGTERWTFRNESQTGFYLMTIGEGILYVGSDDGNLYALDEATGTEIWRFPTGGRVQASASLAAGVAYAGSFDGNVYALDAATGDELWRFPLDSGAAPGFVVAVANGAVYLGTDDGSVYSIGGLDGAPVSPEPTMATAAPTTMPTGGGNIATPAVAAADSRCEAGNAATEEVAPIVPGGAEFVWEVANGAARLQRAGAIALDPDGTIWVNEGSSRLVRFDSSGGFLETWEPPVAGVVAFAPDGTIYMLDEANATIQVFDHDRQPVATWGGFGSGDGQFITPTDIEVDADGNVYVTDVGPNVVLKFDATGTYLSTFALDGVLGPRIGLDAECNLYAPNLTRVIKFAPDGTALMTFGSEGTGDGQFGFAIDVDVDAGGNVYVTDAFNSRVLVFDAAGTFLFAWGEPGSGPGQFNGLDAVRLDGEGNIYVVDYENGRIQKFRIVAADPSDASPVAKLGTNGID